MEGLDNVTSSIGGGLADLGGSIGGFFSDLMDGILDGLSGLASAIGGFFSDLLDGILDGLGFLFVPSVDLGEAFKTEFDKKFPIVDQLADLVKRFDDLGSNPTAPQFTFTYYDTEVSIVNFEDFEEFLPVVKTILVAVCWFAFIIRLYKRLPGIIGGFK